MSPLSAATSLYYGFDGVSGTAASTITDSSGNGLTGTASAWGTGGTAPVYSSNVKGALIYDGQGGALIKSNNTTSLKFENAGVPTNYVTSAGGRVTVDVTPGNQALLQPSSFTSEAFIRTESLIYYGGLFGMTRVDGGPTWQLDNNPSGPGNNVEPTANYLRVRVDHQKVGAPTTSADGWNQSIGDQTPITDNFGDGAWHHVALTYDGTTKRFNLFLDYVQVSTGIINDNGVSLGTGVQDLVYNSGLLFIGGGGGGRAFDGWIDEFRFSNSILATNQFLVAVPEPTRFGLIMLAGVTLLLRRRR